MTAEAILAASPAAALAAAQRQLKEVELLLEAAAPAVAPTRGDPQACALARLLDGTALPADGAMLGPGVVGGRLVVLPGCGAHPRERHLVVSELPDGGVAVLCRARLSNRGPDRALETAHAVAIQAHGRTQRSAGISAAITDVAQLRYTLRDARDAAELAADTGAPVRVVPEVAAALAVRRLRQQVLGELTLADPVVALLEHDRVHGTDLAPTVASWLRHDRDVRRTAQDLNLHPNTLRYRLRRIPEVCAFDPSDPDHLLLARLVLP